MHTCIGMGVEMCIRTVYVTELYVCMRANIGVYKHMNMSMDMCTDMCTDMCMGIMGAYNLGWCTGRRSEVCVEACVGKRI